MMSRMRTKRIKARKRIYNSKVAFDFQAEREIKR